MKVVLITGCSSGIGAALAQAFHHQGCRVVATARRLESLEHLQQQGMAVHALDVTDNSQISQVIDTVIASEGTIDILINNAGYGLMGPLIEMSLEEMHAQFTTNAFAPMAIAQTVALHMKTQGKGLIVNIGSISGLVPTPFAGAYCASKSALHALTETLRMELAPFGLQVVLVQPGAVQSNFGATATVKVQQLLKSNSWYGDRAKAIVNRANASQVDASSVEAIAQSLVQKLLRPSPPPIIRLGKKSLWLPLIKQLLPTALLDRILRRKFGL